MNVPSLSNEFRRKVPNTIMGDLQPFFSTIFLKISLASCYPAAGTFDAVSIFGPKAFKRLPWVQNLGIDLVKFECQNRKTDHGTQLLHLLEDREVAVLGL